jgi:flagellar hook protein FlgE
MGTAIYTGVTGLQVHQRRIDVVATNIANVNTTGYRGARVLFQDLYSQTLEGARGPSDSFGGSNAQQVGLGVRLASIDVNHSQGSLVTTGIASDMAIQGEGLFVLSDGTSQYYTRDGSFQLNSEGVLIDPGTGMRVQGYTADADGIISSSAFLGDLVVPVGGVSIVQPTTRVTLIGNLDATAPVGTVLQRSIHVYDSLGIERLVDVDYEKTTNANEWTWTATFDGGTVGTGTILFDESGAVSSVSSSTVSIDFDPGLPEVPISPFVFDFDFSSVSQLDDDSDVTVSSQNGYPRGVLSSFNIGRGGVVNGVFTNGLTRVIGQVALGNFANVGGLVRVGDNMFRDTLASGTPQIGKPNTGGRGDVSGGALEGSNVDLGTEFSNLIVTQRGFQANARTITTADTLLQETVNLVR